MLINESEDFMKSVLNAKLLHLIDSVRGEQIYT